MIKILIIESGKSINAMINDLIKNQNYEMSVIVSRNSGNKRISNEIPDLVIADLTSIKKEKVELLMQLKNNPVISLVPFLHITSENGMGLDEMQSTQNYYLKKPYSKEEMQTLIRKIIEHKNSLSPW